LPRQKMASSEQQCNFDDMVLHPEVEKAILVAAVGMHHMLLRGSPGTGKSMLALRFPSILPPMGADEHMAALQIYSCAGEPLTAALLAGRPPLRAPHHLASAASVLGGAGTPGELSLAHGGVLFLDELPEFRRDLVESLREPLETGLVRLTRARSRAIWGARVLLIAACNNCPCGWFGSEKRRCRCAPSKMAGYQQRLSGPVLDRIDMHLNMPEDLANPAVLFLKAKRDRRQGTTAGLLKEVADARDFGQERNAKLGVSFNRDLQAEHLVASTGLDEARFTELLGSVVPKAMTTRGVLKLVRVARTLADLSRAEVLMEEHVAQAWKWNGISAALQRGEDIGC
jgi:magnesium chelatase family protein